MGGGRFRDEIGPLFIYINRGVYRGGPLIFMYRVVALKNGNVPCMPRTPELFDLMGADLKMTLVPLLYTYTEAYTGGGVVH